MLSKSPASIYPPDGSVWQILTAGCGGGLKNASFQIRSIPARPHTGATEGRVATGVTWGNYEEITRRGTWSCGVSHKNMR